MVKLTFCVKKRADVSAEFFNDYWLNQHAPLVKKNRAALQISKYMQSHSGYAELQQQAIDARGMSQGYDGFAELWWADIDTLAAALSSEEGIRASAVLAEDEAKFIDLSRSTISFSQEHVIFD